MTRRYLLKAGFFTIATLLTSSGINGLPSLNPKKKMKLTLLRHATLLLEFGGKKILVDPMLSEKEQMDPVQNASNQLRIPRTSLPFSPQELSMLLQETDAVLVTHTHRDHWDDAAQKLIPKDKFIFCQPEDEAKIKSQGFTNVKPVSEYFTWQGIKISRTGGQHGTGEIGKKMGPVSGFILQDSEQTFYVAGDTIWCPEVAEALKEFKPDAVVVNAGAAQFLTGDPITMNSEDVQKVILHAQGAQVIAVHMDTVNHCHFTRNKLKAFLKNNHLTNKCQVPTDGETILL